MSRKPKVSIISITYNQDRYVEQMIKSFLMQETDFDFEVIIADDCSTDKTATIITKYAKNHPKKIKPILRKKNIGPYKNFLDALHTSTGEYIAVCEGDDYWTDEHKLQKQVDFLEKNVRHTLCFHRVRVVYEDGSHKDEIFPPRGKFKTFDTKQLLKNNFIQTNSVLYRRQDYAHLPDDILPADWYMHHFHAIQGEIGFIDEIMSVYRRHSKGLWQDAKKNKKKFWKKNGSSYIGVHEELNKLYMGRPEMQTIIENSLTSIVQELIDLDDSKQKDLLYSVLLSKPHHAVWALRVQQRELQKKQKENGKLKGQVKSRTEIVNKQEKELSERQREITELRNQLSSIKRSRIWRLRNVAARSVGKPSI